MNFVFFVDLDDTFVQTFEKCPQYECFAPVSFDKFGYPKSFITFKQKKFLNTIYQLGEVVFVTGRNINSVASLSLEISTWRVTSFGSFITDRNGNQIVEYNLKKTLQGQSLKIIINDLYLKISIKASSLGINVKPVVDYGQETYIVAKSVHWSCKKLDILENFVDLILPCNFFKHRNGNNLAVIPKQSSKESAVSYLIDNYFEKNSWISIGIGDSFSDWGFLSICDWAVIPPHSQLSSCIKY